MTITQAGGVPVTQEWGDETLPGFVQCHCSEEDGVPDVGVSVGLGGGQVLWLGELLSADSGDIGFVLHGPNGQREVAVLWPGCEWQDAADLLRHHIGPAIARLATPAWQPIATAPKDGTVIWAAFHPHIFPDLRPRRDDLERWNSVQVPLRHPGIFPGSDGQPFDLGWSIAAPVGNGGFLDEWIVGWMPLPTPPSAETAHG